MVRCALCRKDVNDIRPQLAGKGICFKCASKNER